MNDFLPLRQEIAQRAIFITLTTLIFDIIFHINFTHPQETSIYFASKGLLIYAIATIMLTNNYTNVLQILLISVIFAGIFSIYYRIVEFLQNKGFGTRVPDIILGEYVIKYKENKILNAFFWLLVHGGGFFLASLFVKYFWSLDEN